MHLTSRMIVVFGAAISGAGGIPLQDRPDTESWRLLSAPETEQIVAVQEALNRGLPAENAIGLLMMNRPSLVLPLIEQKIEQVLGASSPSDCFPSRNVDPKEFVVLASWALAGTGSEEALVQIAKLIKIDPDRFRGLVEVTLENSEVYSKSRNPFVVAYRGLATGDPELERLIVDWVEKSVAVDEIERKRAAASIRNYGQPGVSRSERMRHFWAEAALDRYGDAMPERDWRADAILSRLHPPLADEIHAAIPLMVGEIWRLKHRAPK
jgi:hypothetical protein